MKSSTIAIIAALLTIAVGFDLEDYQKTFKGDGTYYKGNPYFGHCAMRAPHPPKAYEGRLAVAINKEQYNNGAGCGACLRIKGNGKGKGADPIIGPFEAYISDECSECKKGDVDLGIDKKDGRWEIEWELVPCTPSPRLQILWEGTNPFYWKFQPRGLDSAIKEVSVNGKQLTRTDDNHWIFEPNKSGGAPQGLTRAKFSLKTDLGTEKEGYLDMLAVGTNYATVMGIDSKPAGSPASVEQASPTSTSTPVPVQSMPSEPAPESTPTSTPVPAQSMATETAATEQPTTKTRNPIKKVDIYLDSELKESVMDGESVEIRTDGKGVSFEAIPVARQIGDVTFKIRGEEVTEKRFPYVFPGHSGRNLVAWKNPIYDEEFKLKIMAQGVETEVKITLVE